MTSVVQLESVTKTFGPQTAVNRLDLEIPEGAVCGFIGPNGSGKTTSIRMILRIFYPDSGRVTVLGNDHGAAADDRLGYLPEERGLYRKMIVREVIEFFGKLKGLKNCRPDAEEWLDRLGLADAARKRVDALSKGMAQKVQFISAVIARPRLLILDEPFSGLDPVNMELLKNTILDLRHQGTTVLFSTHDMHVAEKMCDRVCMIYKGNKVLDGTLDEIKRQYGLDTLRMRVGDPACLRGLPGVEQVNNYGQYQELRLGRNGDSRALLARVLEQTTVDHFERTSPSLHDIFVRIAGPGAADGEGTSPASPPDGR